jgi:chaperonin GroES
MNFQPLGDRVLVKVEAEEKTTASGIIIPDNAKEKPNRAKVVAISDFVKSVSVGNSVVFGKYAGTELSLEGTEYLVLEVKDILGVVK